MVLSLLFAAVAAAGIVAEIGPEQATGTSGTWVRALPTERGWRMGIGTNGDFYIADLETNGSSLDGWRFAQESWSKVTDHGDLKDHNVQMCHDGGYLVVSSGNVVDHNDSAYFWFSDDGLQITASGTMEERVPERAHNDMAALCTPWAVGAAFGGYGDGRENAYFFEVESSGSVTGQIDLGSKFVMGAGLLADAPTDRILLTTANIDGVLDITSFAPDWTELETLSLELEGPGQRTYWPSGLIRVGQYYVLTMMSAEDLPPGSGDTGNVHLYIFTEDFSLLEEHQLTDLPSGRDAAMRPWVAHKDDLLIVSYDVMNQHLFRVIRLDMDQVEEIDTGFDEEESEEDTSHASDEAPVEETDKGGCSTFGASAGGLGGLASLLLVAARRRRRSDGGKP